MTDKKEIKWDRTEPVSCTVPVAYLDEKKESRELEKILRNIPEVIIRWSGEMTPINPDLPVLLTSDGMLTDAKEIKKWAEWKAKETKEN